MRHRETPRRSAVSLRWLCAGAALMALGACDDGGGGGGVRTPPTLITDGGTHADAEGGPGSTHDGGGRPDHDATSGGPRLDAQVTEDAARPTEDAGHAAEDAAGSAQDAEPIQPDDCRTAPCQGLTYCDLLSGACLPGCTRDDQCGAQGRCDLATHLCGCAEGWHLCGSTCVSNDAVETCGDRCSPCAAGPEEVAICKSEECATTPRLAQISVGGSHMCGLKNNGEIHCKGSNALGQLEAPPGRFVAISAAWHHTCALRESGDVLCWGSTVSDGLLTIPGDFSKVFAGYGCNYAKEAGSDTWVKWPELDARCPFLPAKDYQFIAPRAHGFGELTCALDTSGGVICWAQHDSTPHRPVDEPLIAMDAEGKLGCGLAADGIILCWGDTQPNRMDQPPAGRYVEIGLATSYGCALDAQGEVHCWGDRSYVFPEALHGRRGFTQLSMNMSAACVLDSEGRAHCWDSLRDAD